jgi:hypothetical protein
MPFSIRPFHRILMKRLLTYNVGPFQGQGTVWNLSSTGWCLSGDLPMRPGETLSLTVTLPNEQCIEMPEAVVRWSRGQEFAVENLAIWPHLLRRSRTVNVGQALSEDLSSVLDSLLPMAPSPQHSARKVSHSRSLLLALLCLVGAACGTTAQTGKILFDDPRGTVSLQTISDRSIQANHPITLEPALLAQLLKGIEISDQDLGHNHVAGFQSVVVGPYASVPVFSEDQIQFLAPLLAEGLRAATPNQSVEYRVVTTREGSNKFQSPSTETTAGSLYAYGRQLYVILSKYRYNQMVTNMNMQDSFGRENTVDRSGLRDRILVFTPKAAQRIDKFDPPTANKFTDRFIAVDYQLLQQVPPAVATTEQPAPQVEGRTATVGESLDATRASEAQARNTEALAQEVETLKKQLESVQKQLDSQTTSQDSPKRKTTPQQK